MGGTVNVIANTNGCELTSGRLVRTDLDYCDIEWFDLEMNRDHSVVFETITEYCILDSFVDYDGYSISSKGLLPTIIDITVV